MTQHNPSESNILENADFEAFYQGKPPVAGMDAGFGTAPWDIGEPQPALVQLEADGEIASEVLDVGCGLGENALFLAAQGYRVTGVDGAETAIARAAELAASRELAATFQVADATRLEGFENRFATVIDSALYHCLPTQSRGQYASTLHRACASGARVHMFCFADVATLPVPAEISVTERELRSTFDSGWHITDLRLTAYTGAFSPSEFQGASADMFRELGVSMSNLDEIDTDERGRMRMPVWKMTAHKV